MVRSLLPSYQRRGIRRCAMMVQPVRNSPSQGRCDITDSTQIHVQMPKGELAPPEWYSEVLSEQANLRKLVQLLGKRVPRFETARNLSKSPIDYGNRRGDNHGCTQGG
jgi:hypothetical protein